MALHKPVLVNEVLEYLNPQNNENFIDGTVGEGGHAIEILKRNGPQGKVLGIDIDPRQAERATVNVKSFMGRGVIVNDSYRNITEIVAQHTVTPVNGILLDLGFSSQHVDDQNRGFSFQKNEMLDMRYSDVNELTTQKIVNDYSEKALEEILENYGEEKFSRQIAKKIVEQRRKKPIESTFELRDIIRDAIPAKYQHGNIHFATRSFQALRIETNHELDNLQEFLPHGLELLAQYGRMVIISFHSLEDRIVKNFFKESGQKIKILTKKPIEASPEEVAVNPRARSAKLRAVIKI